MLEKKDEKIIKNSPKKVTLFDDKTKKIVFDITSKYLLLKIYYI